MNKKAQSISINTIIIAVIALAVLVVLFAIFTGRLGIFSKGVGDTASCANSCKALNMKGDDAETKETCEGVAVLTGNRYISGTYSDVPSGRVCCCK